MAITGDERFLECLRDFHGLEVSPDELLMLHRDVAQRRQESQRAEWNAKQAGDYWGAEDEVTNGKVFGIVFGTALGFLSGGWVGAGLALLSGLLGGRKKADHKREEHFNPQQGFESGGQLAPSGGVLPRIYCNRTINPNGGVRVGGILINSRIDTRRGSSLLYQLYAIAAGQGPNLGYGQLGAIDDTKALFNQQPRSNFNSREITTGYRLGTQNQSQIPQFPYYSQNITPPDYSIFGVDERAKAGASSVAQNPNPRVINVTVTGNSVQKNTTFASGAPMVDAWNAAAFGSTGLTTDGFFQFNNPGGADQMGVGISAVYVDEVWTSLQFGFLFPGDGSYVVVENGVGRTGNLPVTGVSIFKILIDDGQVSYLADDVTVWDSAILPSYPIYPDIKIYTTNAIVTGLNLNGSGFSVDVNSSATILTPTGTSKDITPNQVLDLFTSSQDYVITSTGEVARDQRFLVTDKDYGAQTITTSPTVSFAVGESIYAYWYARYETTKRVDRLDINLAFNLSARHQGNSKDKNNGKLVTHASLFDLWIRPTSEPIGAEVRLARFLVKNATPVRINRAIRVLNLALGRYYFEFRPLAFLPTDQLSMPIYELTDHGYDIPDDTDREDLPTFAPGVTILGNSIQIQGEMEQVFPGGYSFDQIIQWVAYQKKSNVSTESGATGKITSINEIVHQAAINQLAPYKGLALVWYRFVASDRLQQPPGTRTLVTEGSVCPNWMAAGTSNNALSTNTVMVSPSSNFIADGVQAGWILRNLDAGLESVITAVTATTITTTVGLQWSGQCGSRFGVYFLGSTCYFPDVYADMIRNDFGGIPDLLDPDEYIDYPSLVAARKFCVANQYYFDDLIDQRTPFQNWVAEHARLSYLFPTRIDGRYGLVPDMATPVDAVFNAGNSENFVLDYPDWQNNITNTVIIRYEDGRDQFTQFGARHRQVTITVQTTTAYNNLERINSQEIEARSIKNTDQAVNVACLYLKSLQLNNVKVGFETSYAAAYTQAGDIVTVQHSAVDIGDEYSGFVTDVNGAQVQLNCQPTLRQGYATADNAAGITDSEADFQNLSIAVGDLLVNLDTGQSGIITAIPSSTTIAAPVVIGKDDEYAIRNLTLGATFEAVVTRREDGAVISAFVVLVAVGSEVWVQFPSNLSLLPGDYVNIAPNDRYWRVDSIQPNGKERFAVSCTYWQASIYDRTGLVILVDDEVIQG
jgi:hypothetical protein